MPHAWGTTTLLGPKRLEQELVSFKCLGSTSRFNLHWSHGDPFWMQTRFWTLGPVQDNNCVLETYYSIYSWDNTMYAKTALMRESFTSHSLRSMPKRGFTGTNSKQKFHRLRMHVVEHIGADMWDVPVPSALQCWSVIVIDNKVRHHYAFYASSSI